jgi:2-C-methyl-D-erythritol 4-phosphate cytidylyltransferase / 2-C-methyl-D-erythritol 2,4-cyclodiphosphate synthase
MKVAAIVPAAGLGTRAGPGVPKQYRDLSGATVLRRSLQLFEASEVEVVQPVIHPDHLAAFRSVSEGLRKCLHPVNGGATRQQSVFAGLEALSKLKPEFVLVHDAARPLATPQLIARAIGAAKMSGAAVPALPVTDTVKRVDAQGRVLDTLKREELCTVQTPQAFSFEKLLAAHRRARGANRDDFPDDASLAEWAGMSVVTFAGERGNIKITAPEDFLRADGDELLARPDLRTGTGYDVHAFGSGDHVMLGGVKIPHSRGVIGHSDADVVLHALTDAVLGAVGEGDIGLHFPPSDAKWKGASSDRFLAHAVSYVTSRGGMIVNLDTTVLCEAPKIGPHREAMRVRIAEISKIDPARVNVKATTTEGLGFIGRAEGIAAMASATIRLPLER